MKDQSDSQDQFLQHYYLESRIKLAEYAVDKLVNSFNRETICKGWTGARAAFLKALMDTFIEKGVKINAVSNTVSGITTTSYKYPVFLRNGENGERLLEQIIVL